MTEYPSPLFDVFVIAVYLPSLRHKNFLRTEHEREAKLYFTVVFPTLPCILIRACTTQIVRISQSNTSPQSQR
jgi:hypothetical protein